MPHYAHVHLEDPRSDRKYNPGDLIPDDLPGLAELVKYGSAGTSQPENRVVALADGTVIRTIDSEGIENRVTHVKVFDGNFTPEEIKDPNVETPLVTVHQPQRTVIGPDDTVEVQA